LTAALVEGNHVHLAHVGDSRAYLFRGGELSLITEDHTLVHRMVMEGEITEAEAETHPHRSILTRALGVDQAIQVDEMDLEAANGDRILLCSDGLTGMVSDGQIREILENSNDPQEAVDALIRAANTAGGIDNITAVILDFDEDEAQRERTAEAQVPHQPTVERAAPVLPPQRTDITMIGAPIPEPPPQASTRPPRRTGSARPGASRTPRAGRTARRLGVGAGLMLAVAMVALVGLRLYLDSQWFVGVSNGRVAVFRGVPAEIGGFGLHSVVIETTIAAGDAEALALYRELGDGITASDRDGADAIVEQIRQDIAGTLPAGS
jgi:protein phosphatase